MNSPPGSLRRGRVFSAFRHLLHQGSFNELEPVGLRERARGHHRLVFGDAEPVRGTPLGFGFCCRFPLVAFALRDRAHFPPPFRLHSAKNFTTSSRTTTAIGSPSFAASILSDGEGPGPSRAGRPLGRLP